MLASFRETRALSPHVRARVEEVRAYLEANMTRDVDMVSVARQVALSPFYLTRIFKGPIWRSTLPVPDPAPHRPRDRASPRLRADGDPDLPSRGVQQPLPLHHDLPPPRGREPDGVSPDDRLATRRGSVRAEDRGRPQAAPPPRLLNVDIRVRAVRSRRRSRRPRISADPEPTSTRTCRSPHAG
jgi:hypothetical protein